MAEDISNLILDHLRHLRANDDKVMARLDDLVAQFRIQNTHVSGLVQHENYALSRFAELEARLQRVEQRLELRDE